MDAAWEVVGYIVITTIIILIVLAGLGMFDSRERFSGYDALSRPAKTLPLDVLRAYVDTQCVGSFDDFAMDNGVPQKLIQVTANNGNITNIFGYKSYAANVAAGFKLQEQIRVGGVLMMKIDLPSVYNESDLLVHIKQLISRNPKLQTGDVALYVNRIQLNNGLL